MALKHKEPLDFQAANKRINRLEEQVKELESDKQHLYLRLDAMENLLTEQLKEVKEHLTELFSQLEAASDMLEEVIGTPDSSEGESYETTPQDQRSYDTPYDVGDVIPGVQKATEQELEGLLFEDDYDDDEPLAPDLDDNEEEGDYDG